MSAAYKRRITKKGKRKMEFEMFHNPFGAFRRKADYSYEEKSGGETQTPFYVTVVASFVQLYTNNIGGEAIGLVLCDMLL